MTISLDIPADWEDDLKIAARRHGKNTAALLLDSVRQKLRHDILPQAETELLAVINAPLAPEARHHRDALRRTQAERPLTDGERDALADAVDVVEIANAERWQAIAELADRRGLSLAEIARDLEIPLP
ncbi:MAG: hypothetical protein H8F28_26535 [Fibrella sp.]|nr:hypothetical protein [Armatimonadota bacterium]